MLYPVELQVQALPAPPYARPVVRPVLRLRLLLRLFGRTYVRFIETITVAIRTLTAVSSVESRPVLLGHFAFSVLGVLLFIVSLLESHGTNIMNCWGGGI